MSTDTKTLPQRKPYQDAAIHAIVANAQEHPDEPQLCVAPPGAGKSRIMLDLTTGWTDEGKRVGIQVHRVMLLEQLRRNLDEHGIEYGVIASGYSPEPEKPVQLITSQTLYHRAVKRGSIDLPDLDYLLIDEAHQQSGASHRAIAFGSFSGHLIQTGLVQRGCNIVGFTATPLMQSAMYKRLVQIANYSTLRDCNMHQLVRQYSPDEIDTAGLRRQNDGEYSEKAIESRVDTIFGSAYDEWKRLNPYALPAILFAPSVPSSRWFAKQWFARGVPVGHIDGEMILMPENGRLQEFPADTECRNELLRRSKTGEIKLVTNRFVLREAIDMPWLYHGIEATVFGGLATYLQSIGRIQRYWPEYTHKLWQSHGGSYWRHGSPNDDRVWRLGMTSQSVLRERVEACQKGETYEGIRCVKCGMWRKKGPVCLNESCRHTSTVSVRAVRSISGTLKLIEGQVFRKPNNKSEGEKLWTSILFSCGLSGKTVSQAVARFYSEGSARGVLDHPTAFANNPAPRSDDPRYHLKVSQIFPWTTNRKNRSALNAENKATNNGNETQT